VVDWNITGIVLRFAYFGKKSRHDMASVPGPKIKDNVCLWLNYCYQLQSKVKQVSMFCDCGVGVKTACKIIPAPTIPRKNSLLWALTQPVEKFVS